MRVNDLEHMRPELLQVEARDAATETVITLDGELDISSTEWFGAFLGAVLKKHPNRIAIDARRLTYMDSSGLRSFLLGRASALEAGVGFPHRQPTGPTSTPGRTHGPSPPAPRRLTTGSHARCLSQYASGRYPTAAPQTTRVRWAACSRRGAQPPPGPGGDSGQGGGCW
jgi:anti-anti-sigma factor